MGRSLPLDRPHQNKGIGVFARRGVSLTPVPLEIQPLQLFLPCRRQRRLATVGHLDQAGPLSHFRLHRSALETSAGPQRVFDPRWPATSIAMPAGISGIDGGTTGCCERTWQANTVSAYHRHFEEDQGQESQKTFFLQRNPPRVSHRLRLQLLAGDGRFIRGEQDTWLPLSDHMPLIATFPAS